MTPQQLFDLGPVVFVATTLVMVVLERRFSLQPVRGFKDSLRHTSLNALLGLSTMIPTAAGLALLVAVSAWAAEHRVGLLNQVDWPLPVRVVIAVIVIDFADYWRHRAHHRFEWLWRMHRAHHMDNEADATTGLRGHPLELSLAWPWFALWVAALGLDPWSLAARTLCTSVALGWHHSAFKLPLPLERAIALVTPTPRIHRQHHSRDITRTNSNYGTLLTWWDRLFGTFSPVTQWRAERTGLDGFDGEKLHTVTGQLLGSIVAKPQPALSSTVNHGER